LFEKIREVKVTRRYPRLNEKFGLSARFCGITPESLLRTLFNNGGLQVESEHKAGAKLVAR